MSQVVQLDKLILLVAIWDEPGYWVLDRSTKINKKIEDRSFDNNNTSCSDLFILESSKLNKKYKNAFAVSRTLKAVNFIDINGFMVHILTEIKNTVGKNRRMVMMPLESQDELFKLVFLKETTQHKNLSFNSKPNKSD